MRHLIATAILTTAYATTPTPTAGATALTSGVPTAAVQAPAVQAPSAPTSTSQGKSTQGTTILTAALAITVRATVTAAATADATPLGAATAVTPAHTSRLGEIPIPNPSPPAKNRTEPALTMPGYAIPHPRLAPAIPIAPVKPLKSAIRPPMVTPTEPRAIPQHGKIAILIAVFSETFTERLVTLMKARLADELARFQDRYNAA